MTMVDSKVCNAATDTKSTLKCYICGATAKDFNNLRTTNEVNERALRFGLSILHARIRFFESILHLSYKLPVKKWQLRTQTDKNIVKERKALIQEELKNKMGLMVDIPKAGFGNTNDGNTSRRFFNNPELAAEITGVDIRIINRLKIILEVISSGFQIDTTKFATYTMDTAKLYVDLYEWHPMTPTLHKILIHGAVVIEHALLPIGQLSEEAAESRNKHFRLYRLNYARKFSRQDCNIDVLNRLLLSSDPLITSIRPRPKENIKIFNRESLEMIITESFSTLNEDNVIPVNVECLEDVYEESDGESSEDEE